ncbi:MAG: peptidyl-prolyl cis-trans isomerase [Butyrivibrio sp.]|nr:peptidyl-prolyl cis-trans isomerase [Butyrivibrio sp.]
MQRRIPRLLVLSLAAAVYAAGLSACGPIPADTHFILTFGFGEDELFRMEDGVCRVADYRICLSDLRLAYEQVFGSALWEMETDGKTMELRLREEALAEVARLGLTGSLAAANGVVLSDREEALAQRLGTAYYEALSPEEREQLGNITAEEAMACARELILADVLYRYLIRDVNPEISDDEARRITVEQIRVTDRARAVALQQELAEGRSFEELMLTEAGDGTGTFSFGQGEREESITEVAFALNTGQVSGIIETADGYCLLKCVSTFNRAETDANKIRIVEIRRREAYEAKYETFAATQTIVRNEALWERLCAEDSPAPATVSLSEMVRAALEELQ